MYRQRFHVSCKCKWTNLRCEIALVPLRQTTLRHILRRLILSLTIMRTSDLMLHKVIYKMAGPCYTSGGDGTIFGLGFMMNSALRFPPASFYNYHSTSVPYSSWLRSVCPFGVTEPRHSVSSQFLIYRDWKGVSCTQSSYMCSLHLCILNAHIP
jgi:hypothetical protein